MGSALKRVMFFTNFHVYDNTGSCLTLYEQTLDDAIAEARRRGWKIKYITDDNDAIVYGAK